MAAHTSLLPGNEEHAFAVSSDEFVGVRVLTGKRSYRGRDPPAIFKSGENYRPEIGVRSALNKVERFSV
jgi:hypothetical protein